MMNDEDYKAARQRTLQLIGKLSRTKNFPKDKIGIESLADGLMKAAVRHRVLQTAIIDVASETSEYCPTDADLMRIAGDLRAKEDRESVPPGTMEFDGERLTPAQAREKYGKPEPFKADFRPAQDRRVD